MVAQAKLMEHLPRALAVLVRMLLRLCPTEVVALPLEGHVAQDAPSSSSSRDNCSSSISKNRIFFHFLAAPQ